MYTIPGSSLTSSRVVLRFPEAALATVRIKMSARQSNARSLICVPIDSLREAATTKEVETYLLALSSYPDQLEQHRGLTFAQHLLNLMNQEESGAASRYGT